MNRRELIDAQAYSLSCPLHSLYPSEKHYVGISEAYYTHTIHSKPPEDGKIRRLKPAYNWLKLRDEYLHPKTDALDARPISSGWVYTNEG